MIIWTIIFLLIDIISKFIVSRSMNLLDSYAVIRNFFNITYVKNTGAAWSIMSDSGVFLIIISLVIIISIVMYVIRNKPTKKGEIIAYSMILGGAIGNLLNRVFLGSVIDFLDFNIFGYDYPIFNLADTFIVLGIVIVLIMTWRDKNGN